MLQFKISSPALGICPAGDERKLCLRTWSEQLLEMPGIVDWIFWSQLWIPRVTKAKSDQPDFPHTHFNSGEPPEVKWATEPRADSLQWTYPMRPTSKGPESCSNATVQKKSPKRHLPFVQKLPSYRTNLSSFAKIMYRDKKNCCLLILTEMNLYTSILIRVR